MSRAQSIAKSILPALTGLLLFLQSALVLTGGAVRLTGSGLGCPTWPECVEGSYLPVEGQAEGAFHAWIEFGNRLLTFALLFAALATFIAVLKSGRRDLRLLAFGQVAGIFGQGVLGGITVLTDLNPLSVASHFMLSIILIAAATSLHSRRRSPQVRTSSSYVKISRFSITHTALTFIVLGVGTLVTGTGPHAGDVDAPRLDFHIQTIAYIHAALVALLIIHSLAFYFASGIGYRTKRWLGIFLVLSFAQGVLGYIQYLQGVPILLVAGHLLGSVLIWISAWRIRLSIVRKPA